MGNPFDISFVYPIIAGATSLFLVTNDLFAAISAFFSLLIFLGTMFQRVMAYHSTKSSLGLSTISIGFLILSTLGQAVIYFGAGWPEKMGLFQVSPMLTVGLIAVSALLMLTAEALRPND
jgi:hypothetical protein